MDFYLIFHERIPYSAMYNIFIARKSYYTALSMYALTSNLNMLKSSVLH